MGKNDYALIFQGQALEGFEVETVKETFTALMACEPEKTEILFSGRKMIFKRFDSYDEARYTAERLWRIGMAIEVLPVQKEDSPFPSPFDNQEESSDDWSLPVSPAATPVSEADETMPAIPVAPEKADTGTAGGGQGERRVPFVFSGNGSEFFRIWIVNVLLTILTLGIYSAWAKVRTLRYFYGNTSLDGSAFEYLANPLKILQGRIIVCAVLGFFSTISNFYPWAAWLYLPLVFILTPWVVRQSLRFRYHYTAWRGVRFSFAGDLWGAVKAFILWPGLPAIAIAIPLIGLGLLSSKGSSASTPAMVQTLMIPLAIIALLSLLAIPVSWHRKTHYIADNSCFGAAAFANNSTVGDFFKVFFIIAGNVVLIGLICGILGFLFGGRKSAATFVVVMLSYSVIWMFVWAMYKVRMTNLRIGKSKIEPHQLVSSYDIKSYLLLVCTNTLLIILTLGIFYPFAKVRTARYAAGHTEMVINGDLDGFVAERRSDVSALGGETAEFLDIDFGF